MKRMIVLDGNSIMFRAYFATAYTGNLMQARSGLYTNAIYGFVNMINHIQKTFEYDNIFVAFDKGKKTFRHQAYDEYKGGRKKTPDEFIMQIPYIKEFLDVVGIKHLELDLYEADDIVASMATLAKDHFDEVMVVSGDKDLLQLAEGNIHVYLTKKGLTDLECYTEDNFFELMGIQSKQMVDYKGLLGDNSDNLPGVTGCGPKTACKLLLEYGTLENVIANADNIKGKIGEAVKNDGETAKKTKYLATLVRNVDLGFKLEDTIKVEPKVSDLRKFYETVEFKSFLKRLESTPSTEEVLTSAVDVNINTEFYLNDFEGLKSSIKLDKDLYIELELDKDNYHLANILGLSITVNKSNYFFTVDFIKSLKDLLEDDSLSINAIDIKKTYVALKKIGININKFSFDFMLAAYCIDPQLTSSDVKSIFDLYVNNIIPYFTDVYGKKTVLEIPEVNIYGSYSTLKTAYFASAKSEMLKIIKQNDQEKLLFECEIPLAIVLGDMELNGFKLDINRLNEIGEDLLVKMKDCEEQIYELCGERFNIASPKQLGEVLFDHLGLWKGKKNQTGYSTSAEVLEKLAAYHPVPKLVLDYRKYAKLYSTYVLGLKDCVDNEDKVHTIFKQYLTLTGRLSSVEPNVQNIPVRTDDGRLIRSAFVPSTKNGLLISADYSQIELRVLAGLSGCKRMIEMFNNNVDLHAATAALIFGVEPEDVTRDLRRVAKAVNFGIVYGMSAWGLSEEVKVTPGQAADFINKYFETFPEIKTYLDNVCLDAKNDEYTKTILNRRRYIQIINSSNAVTRQLGERTAKNAPIQGSAADIIKLAMINVQKQFKLHNLQSKLICQVHDELVCDVVAEEEDIVRNILKDTMENVIDFPVKLVSEVEVGTNWDLK